MVPWLRYLILPTFDVSGGEGTIYTQGATIDLSGGDAIGGSIVNVNELKSSLHQAWGKTVRGLGKEVVCIFSCWLLLINNNPFNIYYY